MFIELSREAIGLMYVAGERPDMQDTRTEYMYLCKEHSEACCTEGHTINTAPINGRHLLKDICLKWKPFKLLSSQIAILKYLPQAGTAEIIVYNNPIKKSLDVDGAIDEANDKIGDVKFGDLTTEVKRVPCEVKEFDKWFNYKDVIKKYTRDYVFRMVIDLGLLNRLAKSMKIKNNQVVLESQCKFLVDGDAAIHVRTFEDEYPNAVIMPLRCEKLPELGYTIVKGNYTKAQTDAIAATAKMLESAGTLKEVE